MRGSDFSEIAAFAAIVEDGTFARAAARLGVSASALSQTIRNLEERLGVRVLNRTTRAVAMTEVGRKLYDHVRPALGAFSQVGEVVNGFRDRAAGSLRITAPYFFTVYAIAPYLGEFAKAYPDIVLELHCDDNNVDIVKLKYDAGIRLSESIARDMVAVRLESDERMAAIASPGYIAEHGTPRTPHDLRDHLCINWRRPTSGGLYRWEFEKNGKESRWTWKVLSSRRIQKS